LSRGLQRLNVRPRLLRSLAIFALLGHLAATSPAEVAAGVSPDLAREIQAIRAVGLEGAGNPQASAAWTKLSALDGAAMPELLNAMDGANALAANWLRAAIEAIADREFRSTNNAVAGDLGRFLLDARHDSKPRRLAFDLLTRLDPSTGEALLAGMLNDPSPDLRAEAVQKLIRQASQVMSRSNQPAARILFQQALGFARTAPQIDEIAKSLRDLGEKLDLPAVFGFVTHWKVVGPFDSTGGKGFAAVYPPEEKLDFEGEYDGKSGKAKWQEFVTTDDYGLVSLNKPFSPLKGVAGYACAEFFSDRDQEVELRLGSENAWKLWLNGKFLFGQNEYHLNKAIDQYRMNGQLHRGRNLILVKLCQNEQKEDWAGDWDFQLRVCDPQGAPIRSSTAVAQAGSGAGGAATP